MKKRIGSLVTAAVLTAALLAGCGSGAAAGTGNTAGTSGGSASESTAESGTGSAAESGTGSAAENTAGSTGEDGSGSTEGNPAEESLIAPDGKYELEAKTFPFRRQLEPTEDPVEGEIRLYFVNGTDIPYVALSEYMPFVGSIYEDKNRGLPAAQYEITQSDGGCTTVKRTDNGSFMEIDPEKDTIQFLGMDYFTARPGTTMLMSVISLSEAGRGGYSNLLYAGNNSYERNGEALLTLNMSEYRIDLFEKDGECYMPLQTVNDLLVSRNYVLVVFNGIEVIASLYGSDFLSEMYKAPAGEMSEKFALFNYNELRFNLDTFYGLKEEHGIKDFGDFFIATDLMADLADTDSKAFDRALQKLTLKYFDDGHSRLVTNSWLSGQPDADEAQKSIMDDLGLSTNELVSEGTRLKSLRAGFYPDHPEIDPEKDNEKPWFYEEVGDTAVITFDSFFVSKLDYYKEADPEHADDTIELISYAHSQITRAGSPVKNVVVDLSCNNGGMTDAAVFLMSWLQNDGESIVAMKSTLTGAQSVGSYLADINLDGNFDEKDKLPSGISRYIVISGASFSCGNLVPAALKGAPGITLLGKTSGGGSCTVLPCSTASGAVFTISSPEQLSSVRNGSLYNVDRGVEPDFIISKSETMYDRKKLADFIHTLP